MRKNAKRYIQLGEQYSSNDKKATKFESGPNYDLIKRDIWRNKANEAMTKQSELVLDDADMDEIEDFYGCGEMFDRDINCSSCGNVGCHLCMNSAYKGTQRSPFGIGS